MRRLSEEFDRQEKRYVQTVYSPVKLKYKSIIYDRNDDHDYNSHYHSAYLLGLERRLCASDCKYPYDIQNDSKNYQGKAVIFYFCFFFHFPYQSPAEVVVASEALPVISWFLSSSPK